MRAASDITDAYLAAYAMENNATWLSADRGFARFPRLRWSHPLDLQRWLMVRYSRTKLVR